MFFLEEEKDGESGIFLLVPFITKSTVFQIPIEIEVYTNLRLRVYGDTKRQK